jgi:hypothetical protein
MPDGIASASRLFLLSGNPGVIFFGFRFLFWLVFATPLVGGAQQSASPGEESPVLVDEPVEAAIDPDEIGLDQLDGLGDEDEAELPSWVDDAHATATHRVQALAQHHHLPTMAE